MRAKASELSGEELNYAVGIADGMFPQILSGPDIFQGFEGRAKFEPTLNWWHCGMIIQKGCILFDTDDGSIIWAKVPEDNDWIGGSNHQEAACRAYVRAKLGKEFEVYFPKFIEYN